MTTLNQLHATLENGKIRAEVEEPVRTCENGACGVSRKSSDMINVMIGIGSPGHAMLAPFQCPGVEHWACSPACWREVAHACIEEHMHDLLLQLHTQTPESVHHEEALTTHNTEARDPK